MHLFRPTITEETVSVRVRSVFSSTTRYIAYVIDLASAPSTHAVRLSNSKNSNVQHVISRGRENYESLEEDNWNRYNSTKTSSCHMIFAPLVDMDISINASKCQSCGHSIRGETKDPVDNISSAQKPERTDL